MEETRIQRRFTVTIPRRVREALGLTEGTNVIWQVQGNTMVLQPKTFRTLRARFKGKIQYGREEKEAAERTFTQLAKEHHRRGRSVG